MGSRQLSPYWAAKDETIMQSSLKLGASLI